MGRRALVIVLGLSLILLAWIGLFSSGIPAVWCPMPLLTVLPAFALSPRIAIFGPMLFFFIWNLEFVVSYQPSLPKRTISFLGVLSALTIVYFFFVWEDGLRYQGVEYTKTIVGINTLFLTGLWYAVIHACRRPSYRAILLTHWLLFVWLGWCAFPFLGELP